MCVTKMLSKTDVSISTRCSSVYCMSSLLGLATDHCIKVRLFKLAPLYSCGCSRDLIFTQTCYIPEILNSNCTMILALSFLVQLKTLITLANVPPTSNCFPSQFIRYLASLTYYPTEPGPCDWS